MLVDAFVTLLTIGLFAAVAYGAIRAVGQERLERFADKLGF